MGSWNFPFRLKMYPFVLVGTRTSPLARAPTRGVPPPFPRDVLLANCLFDFLFFPPKSLFFSSLASLGGRGQNSAQPREPCRTFARVCPSRALFCDFRLGSPALNTNASLSRRRSGFPHFVRFVCSPANQQFLIVRNPMPRHLSNKHTPIHDVLHEPTPSRR